MAIVEKIFTAAPYNAPTDGTSNASPALAIWLTDAAAIVAAGDTPKLRMGGHTYNFAGVPNGPSDGLSRAIIDGEGATVGLFWLGNSGVLRQNFLYSARIGTVMVGATSATIIQGPYPNDVNTTAAFLSVGKWILVSGISMQAGGYPPNFQYNEFRKITGIVGNVVSWAEPLVYEYKQTWPLCDTISVTVSAASPAVVTMPGHGLSAGQLVTFSFDVGGALPTATPTPITRYGPYFVLAAGLTTDTFRFAPTAGGTAINTTTTGSNVILHTQTMDQAGPATIWGMMDHFEGEHHYSNITCTYVQEIFGGGTTSLILDNVDFTGDGPCPSVSKSWIHRNSQFGSQNEIDKCVEYCEYNNCTGGVGLQQLLFFSPGCMEMLITGCTFKTLNGSPHNLTIVDCNITEIGAQSGFLPGSTAYGHTNRITITNSTIPDGEIAGTTLALADFVDWTFSAGVFSVLITNGRTKNEAIRCFVPGYKYIVGLSGGRNTTPETGDPVIFTVTDMYQDATHLRIVTNLASATWPNYGGGFQPDAIFTYGAKVITQSGGSGIDATQFDEPGRTFALHLVASSPPSYTNPGGQGDRTSIITVSGTMTAGSGSHSMLVNGSEADEYWLAAGQNSKTLIFDFGVGASKIISEFTWTQSTAIGHGSAQSFAGSTDNVSYTTFPESFALGGSATTVVPITNSTGYRYYRISFPGTTSASPYVREIKFKIS